MQFIMAYHQHKKFENKQLGGVGVEIETDIFILGESPKNGLGFKSLNKAYIQFLGERHGDVLVEPYPNPKGGSEALTQIQTMLDEYVAPKSILHSDSARAVKAWVMENPNLDLFHVIVTHSQAKYFGFTWLLYVDEDDGHIYSSLKKSRGEYRIITAGTQSADGFASVVKQAFRKRGGISRKNVRAELKEVQFRRNERGLDLYLTLLTAWGKLETALGNGEFQIEYLEALLKWDYHVYDNLPDEFPKWTCPGCEFETIGEDWRKERTSHRKSCQFYKYSAPHQYEHLKSRCCCCVYPFHETRGMKIKITNVTSSFFFSVS